MAGAGFGIGIGLQGQPPLYGQYYGQRQIQEEAAIKAREAAIKRDDDNYKKILADTTIKPESVHWKVQPLVQEAVADFTYQVNEARKADPVGWENKVPSIRQATQLKFANLMSTSAKLKDLDEMSKNGEYLVPEEVVRFSNTGQGDLKSNRPGKLTQALYGVALDDATGNMALRPVKKVNIAAENAKLISSKEKMYQDVVGKDGKPVLFPYKSADGKAVEYRSRRALTEDGMAAAYAELSTNRDYAQNNLIEYINEKKKEPGFTEAMVLDENGSIREDVLVAANEWGFNRMKEVAKQYFTTDQISMPASNNTNITVNSGDGSKVAGTGEITQGSFYVEQNTGKKNPDGTPQVEKLTIKTPAQFTTKEFNVKLKGSPSVRKVKGNVKLEEAGVSNFESSGFAVVPIYQDGSLVSEGDQASKNLEELVKSGKVKWGVIAIGLSSTGEGEDKVTTSVYLDADEVIGAATTPLPGDDTQGFKKQMKDLKATADRLNKKTTVTVSKKGATPPATKLKPPSKAASGL